MGSGSWKNGQAPETGGVLFTLDLSHHKR